MESTIFWDKTPCSPLKAKRRFGGTYLIHLQGRRSVKVGGSLFATCFHAGFLLGLFFDPDN
jgi:hypothetical protein